MADTPEKGEQFKIDTDNKFPPDFGAQLEKRGDWWRAAANKPSDGANEILHATKFGINDNPNIWHPPSEGEFATNEKGDPLDPIQFYFHGSLKDMKRTFEKAGWTEAEDEDFWGTVEGVLDREKWPMSPLFYQGADCQRKEQVTGFSAGTSWDRSTRHHLRIFDTGKMDEEGNHVWAVAASRDDGYEFDKGFPPVKHTKDPDTDKERDHVLQTLKEHGIQMDPERVRLNFKPNKDGTSQDGVVYDIWLGAPRPMRVGPHIVGPDPGHEVLLA